MPKKNTTNLENELRECDSLDRFLKDNKEELSTNTLTVQIQALSESKGMTKADVVKACNLNEIYAYQILSGVRRPSRDKLLWRRPRLCSAKAVSRPSMCATSGTASSCTPSPITRPFSSLTATFTITARPW